MTTCCTRSWISRCWRHENTPSTDDLLCCGALSFPAVQVSPCVDTISIYSDLISHCLLMFGWSWQNFCIHNMGFLFPSASRRTSEDLLCSPCLRSKVELNVWIFMWVHVRYTRKKEKWRSSETFCSKMRPAAPLNVLACRSSCCKDKMWMMRRFCATEKNLLFTASDSVVGNVRWRRLKHQGQEEPIKVVL